MKAKQSYFLKNDFIFTPSFSINASYIIQDDLDETGGDLALTLKNDDLLVVKPEIGFSLNKNFKNSEVKSENFIFSIYAEQFGFLGVALILILLGIFIFSGLSGFRQKNILADPKKVNN